MRTPLATLLAGAGFLAASHGAHAQSITHFYKDNQFARTTAVLPKTSNQSVVSETVQLGSDQAVHVTNYLSNGTINNSFLIDNPGVDDQNVAIVALSNKEFAVVSNEVDPSTSTAGIRITRADITGTILASNLFRCNHPSFNSFYALDMKWDNANNQFVLCGTAFNDLNCGVTDPKDAFVLTVSPTLSTNYMRYFISTSGNSTYDYDVATRVIPTGNGYYVTGGINMHKPVGPGGYYKSGLRSMLIDPLFLNYTPFFGWSRPLSLQTDNDEMSADMLADPSTGEFLVLTNYVGNASSILYSVNTGIVRINPGNGNPTIGIVERAYTQIPSGNGIYNIGHTITAGDKINEVVVHGDQVDMTGQQIEPYYSVFDISTVPAANTARYVYQSVVGNNNGGGLSAMTYGGFYAPINGFALPLYLNRFADRERPGAGYTVVAPIFGGSGDLNTKFLTTTTAGKNGCVVLQNPGQSQLTDAVLTPPFVEGSDVFYPIESTGVAPTTSYNPFNSDDCSNGYYRQAAAHTPAAAEAAGTALSVSPNPASTTLTLALPATATGALSVQLLDISGRKLATLFDGPAAGARLVCAVPATLPGGLYLLKVACDGKELKTEKVTIAR